MRIKVKPKLVRKTIFECSETDCKNQVYGFDPITPLVKLPVCRKHYRMYVLGWSEYEATRGKREKLKERII